MASEQHLFRRTQVRQILETLRQFDVTRYLQEVGAVIISDNVRYHIKVAITQWLGSLSDPLKEECDIVLALDTTDGPFPPLVRHALFTSSGWFDTLFQSGWVLANLIGGRPERVDTVLWWLSNIAGQRPTEVATLLDRWWGGTPERGRRLLDWFGLVRRQKPDDALIDLCCRITRSNPPGLFEGRQSNRRDMLLHTWAGENPEGAANVLKAYFDAWFEAHPNQHPFERDEFRDFDAHSLGELAKKAPETFIEGSIDAFVQSIDLITSRMDTEDYDYSFKLRYYTGHHFGADAFLDMFRAAMCHIASTDSKKAENFLRRIAPNKHEVCTHLWLEAIAAKGSCLSHLFADVLDSPHLFNAGWHGANWKSFAEAAKVTIPFLRSPDLDRVSQLISGFNPEQQFASKLLARIRNEGEQEPWQTRRSAMYYVSSSGHEQWCVLETIGKNLPNGTLKERLEQLRRKFRGAPVSEPHHLEARYVQSPIKREQTMHMTDTQWLKAMERYDNDEDRRRGRTFVDGGASQLAEELKHCAKMQPVRFVNLLERMPEGTNQSYVSRLLWGLAEANDLDDDILRRAIFNAHARSNHPYGSDIARLIEKQPSVAADPTTFAVLVWYIEHGEADSDEAVVSSTVERELITIEDLLNSAGGLHVRGMNGARGWAAEILGNVLWQVPEAIEGGWHVLERRAIEEPLLSVRCCLIRPTVPLFNIDQGRCAELADRLSRSPEGATENLVKWVENGWLCLAFPPERTLKLLKQGAVWCAGQIERFARRDRARRGKGNETKWWLPLLTSQGVYLLPFLLRSVPSIGKKLIYRLVVDGDDTSRVIGAWHVFRRSFQDAEYAPLADALANHGVLYRRVLADIASRAVTIDEYRYRAEKVLQSCFNDPDKQVRNQAADVFRNIKAGDFVRYRGLANDYLNSKAFESESWAFFHALDEAECKVDDIVISATEKMIDDIKCNGNAASRSMDLHQLQDIIKDEYASSEGEPKLRRRLLDLIDGMLQLELYGVDTIIKAHER